MPEYHHIVCACTSDEHTLRLMHFKARPETGDDYDEMYWSVYLRKWPWYKRLWIAVRYIFGHRSKYGDFDSGPLMDARGVRELREWLGAVDADKLDL